VSLAKRATELIPKEKGYWITLGLAHYRAGNWQEAVTALTTALQQAPVDGWKLFVLAMAHWQLGHKEEGRRYYEEAVVWTDRHETRNRELRRFRTEAAELLGPSKTKKD
jgi:uncharacterized protein HemY